MCLCILASVKLCVWLLLLFISESTTGQPQSWFHVVFSLQRVQCPLHASPYVSVSSGVCGFPKEYNRSATELVPRCFSPQRVQCPPPCVSVSISSVTESVPRFFPLKRTMSTSMCLCILALVQVRACVCVCVTSERVQQFSHKTGSILFSRLKEYNVHIHYSVSVSVSSDTESVPQYPPPCVSAFSVSSGVCV